MKRMFVVNRKGQVLSSDNIEQVLLSDDDGENFSLNDPIFLNRLEEALLKFLFISEMGGEIRKSTSADVEEKIVVRYKIQCQGVQNYNASIFDLYFVRSKKPIQEDFFKVRSYSYDLLINDCSIELSNEEQMNAIKRIIYEVWRYAYNAGHISYLIRLSQSVIKDNCCKIKVKNETIKSIDTFEYLEHDCSSIKFKVNAVMNDNTKEEELTLSYKPLEIGPEINILEDNNKQ